MKTGSSVYYEIADPHGDVAALANAAALVGTEHFDAWGSLGSVVPDDVPPGHVSVSGVDVATLRDAVIEQAPWPRWPA